MSDYMGDIGPYRCTGIGRAWPIDGRYPDINPLGYQDRLQEQLPRRGIIVAAKLSHWNIVFGIVHGSRERELEEAKEVLTLAIGHLGFSNLVERKSVDVQCNPPDTIGNVESFSDHWVKRRTR